MRLPDPAASDRPREPRDLRTAAGTRTLLRLAMEFRLPSLVTRIFGEPFLAFAWSAGGLAVSAFYAHSGRAGIAAIFAIAAAILAFQGARGAIRNCSRPYRRVACRTLPRRSHHDHG